MRRHDSAESKGRPDRRNGPAAGVQPGAAWKVTGGVATTYEIGLNALPELQDWLVSCKTDRHRHQRPVPDLSPLDEVNRCE
jgi:hypothetical protein